MQRSTDSEEDDMNIDGSCHCGAIRYEAEADPAKVTICHCTDCQSLTGSAFRVTVGVPEDKFTIVAGAPRIYVKTAASGAKRAQGFCADCGSPIYATSVGEGPKIYGVRTGTARQREQLKPTTQIWHGSALPWVDEIAGLQSFERERKA